MSEPILFGKLPACGDFVAHGLPVDERRWWDERLSLGTAQVRADDPDGWEGAWTKAVPWCFRLRLFGRMLSGALALSRDRVGRHFPVVLAYRHPNVPIDCAAAITRAITEELDAIELLASLDTKNLIEPVGLGEERPKGWWPATEKEVTIVAPDPADAIRAMAAHAREHAA